MAGFSLASGMNWFYAGDGQQAGPVSDAQLDELLRSGKINQDTRVWREGMTDWQALHAVRPGAPPPITSSQSEVTCAECGRSFPPGEVIMLNRSWVCAGCKPMFLQRLREGAMPSGAAGGLWRTKNQLVTRSEIEFPDRCVRCNAPANGYRLKRQLYWHPPAYFLFILLNLVIYAIVAVCVRKKAIVHIGLCDKHRVRRKWGIVVCWIGVLGGFGMIISGAVGGAGIVALIGIVLLLGAAIYGGITGARISAARITKENVWLKGVNKDFLAELPEWTGP
jgi:hypothetical protein